MPRYGEKTAWDLEQEELEALVPQGSPSLEELRRMDDGLNDFKGTGRRTERAVSRIRANIAHARDQEYSRMALKNLVRRGNG